MAKKSNISLATSGCVGPKCVESGEGKAWKGGAFKKGPGAATD